MASYLSHFNLLFQKSFGNIFSSSIGSIRNASKSGSRPVKSRGGKLKTRTGIKVTDNQFVHSGQYLCHQKSFGFYPGLNVAICRSAGLYAKTSGKIFITTEKTNFKENSRIVTLSSPLMTPIYGRYINVVPSPQHQAFKLVEQF